ncbi:hypothetical protein P171DRAFT_405893 [Karstenula rhodostoma CBS 690.94]|uniref:Zn(2)-C6 fungal-type domain-containing protein n=1 Tax=Karstenula rhodostoma CBS 690.94 TaxID=1392251 RepID=A0A9P4UG17_9PLEO|nr:hypothetical protein P171DRAFT_405893 [Karstenula rhodostoma CBS 690.94]
MEDEDAPPAKRLKSNACQRCRKRKQKCDDQRPCANCTRSHQQCIDPPSIVEFQSHGYVTHDSLGRLADIASLEERITRLEESHVGQDHESHRRLPLVPASLSWANAASPFAIISSVRQSAQVLGPTVTSPALDPGDSLSASEREALFSLYIEKVHSRYPFLRMYHLQQGLSTYPAFFCNLVYAIGLLLSSNGHARTSRYGQQDYYDAAVTHQLSAVFAQSDRLLHIQAHLLLSMHALFSPSTEGVISAASTTMRFCVMAQLHLADAEPPSTDIASKVLIQMRRRIFWSAYTLDRTVSAVFDIPFCIPDSQVTVKLFANIDDGKLETCCEDAFPNDPPSFPGLTDVSAAMHVVYCRQIQSEILNTTLHRDFQISMDTHHRWRFRVIEKLDKWRSLCHRYADKQVINFSNSEWLHMIYNYSLAMLYQPTRRTASEAAGDWTVKACTQALLIFRKFQRQRPLTDLWLGLIAQFKCGVALLYCYFATSPEQRSPTYDSLDVSEAVRACSITLSLLAERWPQSKCLRDAFDILAREIPLFEPGGVAATTKNKRHMRSESAESLREIMPNLELLVVNRSTMRMLHEMITNDFARSTASLTNLTGNDTNTTKHSATANTAGNIGSRCSGVIEDFFQPYIPQYILFDNIPGSID